MFPIKQLAANVPMMRYQLGKFSANSQSQLSRVILGSRGYSDNDSSRRDAPRQVPYDAQSFNSKDHEFTPYRARETMDRSNSAGYNMEANIGSLDMGQGRHDEVQSSEDYGSHAPNSQEQIRQDIYARGEVSLDSVMQSNVPEPFDGTGHEGTSHMNMPGGGSGRANKYLYSNLHSHHPSKNYSTSASASSLRAFSAQDVKGVE